MPILVSVVKRIDPCCKTRWCLWWRFESMQKNSSVHSLSPLPSHFLTTHLFLHSSLPSSLSPFLLFKQFSNSSGIGQRLHDWKNLSRAIISKPCSNKLFPTCTLSPIYHLSLFLAFCTQQLCNWRQFCAESWQYAFALRSHPETALPGIEIALQSAKIAATVLSQRIVEEKDSRNESESPITASCQKWKCIKSVFCISFYRLPSLPPHHHHHSLLFFASKLFPKSKFAICFRFACLPPPVQGRSSSISHLLRNFLASTFHHVVSPP